MSIDIREFERLQQKVERLQSESNKARKKYEKTLWQIENEFGCTTIEDAIKLGKKLKTEAEESEQEYQTALEKFQEEWEEKL